MFLITVGLQRHVSIESRKLLWSGILCALIAITQLDFNYPGGRSMKYTVTFIISFLFLILFAGTTIATPIPLNFEINKFDTIVNLSNVDIDGWAGISADIAAFDLDNPAAFSLGVGETKEIDFIDIEVGGFLEGELLI